MKNRTGIWMVAVATLVGLLGLVGLVTGSVYAQGAWDGDDCGGYGMMGMMGRGMMGSWGDSADCPLLSEDGGYGEPWGRINRDIAPLSLTEARETAETFIADLGENLVFGELMEFSNHFYGTAVEADSGIGAYEFLIDRYTGETYPEMGPNMMWNTKYGMMGSGFSVMGMMGRMMGRGFGADIQSVEDMDITPEKAVQKAQEYLERNHYALTADEHVDPFYGYYTLHVLKDGEVAGMLSVNGYTGRVWFHSWHGDFVDMIEEE